MNQPTVAISDAMMLTTAPILLPNIGAKTTNSTSTENAASDPNSDAARPAATTPAIGPSICAIRAEKALIDGMFGYSTSEHIPTSAQMMANGTRNNAVEKLAIFALRGLSVVLIA